jgi:hypothetical protein
VKIKYSITAFFVFLISGYHSGIAQSREKELSFSWGTDLKKGYFWRGLDMEHNGSIQPYLSASWKNFTLGTWSAFRISGDGSDEVDLYLSKAIGPLTVTLFDYWSYSRDYPSKYFDLASRTTSHLLECEVILSGEDIIPLNFLASWFFYGSDPTKSLYFELQFVHSVFKGEATLYAGYQARGSYYATKSGFVNTGLSITYPLTSYKNHNLDFYIDLMGNPSEKKLLFNFGLCFYR